MSIFLDKSKVWYYRYRDAEGHHRAVRIARKSDALHSRRDVLKSAEYKAVEESLNDGYSPNQIQLLDLAEECGLSRAVIAQLLKDGQQAGLSIVEYVETRYWLEASQTLRPKTLKEYRGIWTRYHLAERLQGFTVATFRPCHGNAILKAHHQAHFI